MSEKYISPKELSKMTGLKVNSLALARYQKRWSLPYYKVGSRVRYKLSEVEAWLAENRREGDK